MFAVLSLSSSGIENARGPDDGHSERKTLGAAQLVAGTALLVLIGPPYAERGPSAAWALEAGYQGPQQIARRETSRYRGVRRPSSEENAKEEAPEDATSTSSSGALAAALAACEKDLSGTAGLTLPGAKGAIRLDSCYRGRDQFVCSLNTLLDGPKSSTAISDTSSRLNIPRSAASMGSVASDPTRFRRI